MKYLVMECHLSHAVVLRDDGRFLKVANMRYEVGQTVENVIEMQIPEVHTETKSRPRWIAPLVSMAACLVLVVTMMFFQAPYASVYMIINPEVRIDVNRSDVVVGVEGVNADGIDLLDGYEFKKKHLDTVMDELVDRAIAMGYLSDGGTVTLTLDADDEWVVSHSDSLSTHLNEYLTENISVTIEITGPRNQEVVIPVDPDYDNTDYGTEPPTVTPTQAPTQPAADTDYDDTDYGPNNDGVTDYDAPDDGDDITDDGGDTNYNEDESDDSDSGYDDDGEDPDDDDED